MIATPMTKRAKLEDSVNIVKRSLDFLTCKGVVLTLDEGDF